MRLLEWPRMMIDDDDDCGSGGGGDGQMVNYCR